MIRAMLFAFAAATLICAFIDRPKPVKSVQVDFCVINYRAAGKDEFNNIHFGWSTGFGPCSLLDRYENI